MPGRSRTNPPPRRHRLLVVDDEAYNVELVARTFHRTATVLPAADRAQAEAVLAAEPIDVALIDYRLDGPRAGLGTCGLDLARVVRARRPGAAIAMITGFADDPALAEALAAGVIDALIAKPWAPVELRRQVEALLAGAAAP